MPDLCHTHAWDAPIQLPDIAFLDLQMLKAFSLIKLDGPAARYWGTLRQVSDRSCREGDDGW